MSAAVVMLPTAAPRKVNNQRFAQQRRAGIALLNEQGAFDFPIHHDREAVIKAERLTDFMEANMPLRPDMAVLLGLVQLLTTDQLERLCTHVMACEGALTLVEMGRADTFTKWLVWAIMQRRGLV
jgi:hypothetical protein